MQAKKVLTRDAGPKPNIVWLSHGPYMNIVGQRRW